MVERLAWKSVETYNLHSPELEPRKRSQLPIQLQKLGTSNNQATKQLEKIKNEAESTKAAREMRGEQMVRDLGPDSNFGSRPRETELGRTVGVVKYLLKSS
jgi:hypothetical protein